VAEATETNNVTWRAMQVGPDLVISDLTVPATGGGVITVNDTTTNQGTSGAAPTVTRFYLSTNSLFDANDLLLEDHRPIPALGPGASSSGPTSLTIPANTSAGTYYVIARADSDLTVAEAQETNNTLGRSFQIGGDLVVTALTVPSKFGGGASFEVTDTTTNQVAVYRPSSTQSTLDRRHSGATTAVNGSRSACPHGWCVQPSRPRSRFPPRWRRVRTTFLRKQTDRTQ
jgi:subtilase family serine protease